jgi:hypothetical protein
MEFKTELSSAELAKLMGVTRQAIQQRAALEGWPARPRLAQGGGNIYIYESLPWDVQRKILARHFDLDPRYINHP